MFVQGARGAALWIGLLLLGITVMPIWFSTVFPSQDGSVHVYVVDALRQYRSSEYLQQFLAFNQHAEPNLLIYPIMYFLSELFGNPTAEKILLTLLGCLFFASAVYAVRSFHRDSLWLAVLLLPATYHHLVYKGFYNYSASLIGFLFGLSYWYRHRDELRRYRLVIFAGIAFLTTLAHLMGFVLLGFAIAVVSIVVWLASGGSGRDWRASTGDFVRQSAWLALAFLPAALLVLDFVRRYSLSAPDPSAGQGMLRLAIQLVTMAPLFLFDQTEAMWMVTLFAAIAYLGVLSLATTMKRPVALGLLAVIVGLVLLYFFAPISSKGLPIADRILPVLYFTVILWLAACYRSEHARRYLAVAVVGALVTVASGVSRAWHHSQIDAYVRDYLSLAAEIEPKSTILNSNNWRHSQLLAGQPLSWRVDPFRHMAAMLALGNETVFLGASLLSRSHYGYFPLYYRSETDWIRFHDRATATPETADRSDNPARSVISDYNRQTPSQIDYLTLWPVVDDDLTPFAGVLEQLGHDYELVAKSRPLGLAYLYRHRGAGADRPGDPDLTGDQGN